MLKRFAIHTLLNLVASVCNKSFALFLSLYCATQLSTAQHGKLGLVIFLLAVFSGAASTVAMQYVSNEVAHNLAKKNALLGVISSTLPFLTPLVFASALLLIFPLQFRSLLGITALSNIELWSMLYAAFCYISAAILSGVLQGARKFDYLAKGNALTLVTTIPIAVGLVQSADFTGAILAIAFHASLQLAITGIGAFKSEASIQINSSFREVIQGYLRIFPIYTSALIVALAQWVSIRILANSGLESVSIFTIVWQIGLVISQVMIAISGSIISRQYLSSNEKFLDTLNFVAPLGITTIIASLLLVSSSVWGTYFFRNHSLQFPNELLATIMAVSYINALKGGISRNLLKAQVYWVSLLSSLIWALLLLVFISIAHQLNPILLGYIYIGSHLLSFALLLPIFLEKKVFSLATLYSKDFRRIHLISICVFGISLIPVSPSMAAPLILTLLLMLVLHIWRIVKVLR